VVAHVEGGTQDEVLSEYGAEENIWTLEGRGKKGEGKTT
jgi:hypothetical protein